MTTTDFFWENHEQAHQRLNNGVILFGGSPVFVQDVQAHTDGVPRAHIHLLPSKDATTKKLNNPLFERFRQSVPLGYINCFFGGATRHCSFLERTTPRTVLHGLTNNNVGCQTLNYNGSFTNDKRFMAYVYDQSFVDMAIGNYPTFKETAGSMIPASSVAIHRNYALVRNERGLISLFRGRKKIASVPDANTVLLLPGKAHWKEEIQDMSRGAFKDVLVRES